MKTIDKVRYVDNECGVFLRHLTAAELRIVAQAATELAAMDEDDREEMMAEIDGE